MNAVDFIENNNQGFKRKINHCLISYITAMDNYKKAKEDGSDVSAKQYLEKETMLSIMLRDVEAFDDAVDIMGSYAS